MPKIIELTVEIDIDQVSCPGVWLCQDGRVSLTVFALGTSYQTCLLPPMFPLMFKDIFYFRKRFQETCALNNICCLLKEETIYCELVQWCRDCQTNECVVLAQYLGALNDVLFPPNVCSNDGVDLLMRRTKVFPGILSPKIEISTKVRIDEVWNQYLNPSAPKVSPCECAAPEREASRQKQVCHSARYHRYRCVNDGNCSRGSQSRSKSRSEESRSCSSLMHADVNPPWSHNHAHPCHNPMNKILCHRPRRSPRRPCDSRPQCHQYSVYNVRAKSPGLRTPTAPQCSENTDFDENERFNIDEDKMSQNECDDIQKVILESRYIKPDKSATKLKGKPKKIPKPALTPCVCEICQKYHELFHSNQDSRPGYYKI